MASRARWAVVSGLVMAWACTTGSPGGEPAAESPGGGASGSGSPLELIGPEWRVTQIGDRTITPEQVQVEPYLVFDPQGARHRVAGSAGCNRLAGGYRTRGARGLEFEDLIGTEMGCERGMDIEQALGDTLLTVRSYRIVGRALELLDDGGRVAVRLEAR